MAKRALLVGINDYHHIKDLRGCLNDLTNMRDILKTYFGFAPEDIRVLSDDRATKVNIMKRLEWLVESSRPGDHLVFHFSGHGSQIRDRDDYDELEDQMDEILCPYDMDWDGTFIVDDDLDDIISGLREGVLLEVFLDCCHSGTGTRELELGRPPELGPPQDAKPEAYLQARYLDPPVDIQCRSMGEEAEKRRRGFKGSDRSTLNHVLWAGCADFQTSADAYIEGDYNGAFTFYLCRTIRRHGGNISRDSLYQQLKNSLQHNRYSQIPQLECESSRESETVLTFKPVTPTVPAKPPRFNILAYLAKIFSFVGDFSREERQEWFNEKRKKWFNIEQVDTLRFFYDLQDVSEAEAFQPPAETRDAAGFGKYLGNFFESLERYFQYQHMRAKDVPRIVSEGDSWFMHPLVSDLIDHLYNDCAVFDLSAAGDELRQMLKQDDFVDAIVDEKPQFFMLSGGGNDFLGEEYFKDFLNPWTPGAPGKRTDRFIRQSFSAKLDKIKRDLARVLQKIVSNSNLDAMYTTEKPLHVFLHGYDYAIPGTIRKGSWIRPNMIKKDILHPVDQNAIIRYMLDEFNAILQRMADEHPQDGKVRLHFMDLRGILEREAGNSAAKRKRLWYDEIHPSDAGYKILAQTFKARIKELTWA